MKRINVIIILLLLSKVGVAQTIPTFSKFFVQDSFYCGNLTVLRDGDSLVIMPNFQDGSGFQGFFFVKIDLTGREAYRFVISQRDTIYASFPALDAHRTLAGEFIRAGSIFHNGSLISAAVLYKIKSNLDTAFIRTIPADDASFTTSANQLSDGNYMLSGAQRHDVTDINGIIQNARAWLIKADTSGNVIWQKEEWHSYESFGNYISVFPGGFYFTVEVGLTPQSVAPYNSGDSLLVVEKYDNNGNLKWTKGFGVPGHYNYIGPTISLKDGGGIQIINLLDTGNVDTINLFMPTVIYKFDSNGNIVWQRWLRDANFASVHELESSSLLFCESVAALSRNDFIHQNLGGVLYKLDKDGNLLWQQRYIDNIDTNYDAYFFDATEAADGGMVATGQAVEAATHHQGAWLVKVDSNGCLNGHCPTPATGIDEVSSPVSVFVFPNPASSQFTVALAGPEDINRYHDLRFALYDLTGRVVYSQPITQQITIIQREGLSDGLYIWKLSNGEKQITSGKIALR
jgi:hypothetical protein